MRIIIRVFAAHSAVGALILLTAALAKTAVFAGVCVAFIEAYLFAVGAKLTLVQAVLALGRASVILAVAAFGAVCCTAAAKITVAADELVAVFIFFAALVAQAALLTKHILVVAEALAAGFTMQSLIL